MTEALCSLLLRMKGTRPSETITQHPLHSHQDPADFEGHDQFVSLHIFAAHQKARRHSSSSTVGVRLEAYIFLRCAPTSTAARIPAPITAQVVCGAAVPWRNSAMS